MAQDLQSFALQFWRRQVGGKTKAPVTEVKGLLKAFAVATAVSFLL
jgi:hypothetical protein